MTKHWLRNIIKTAIAEKAFASIAYCYFKFVGKTTRWQSVVGVEELYKALEKYGSIIVVGWHGRTLEMPFFWDKSRTINALVSPSRDGKMIVNILAKFGIGNVSGSTNRNAFGAALELMRNLHKGNSIAIIPDGPRGPSMQMTMSPLFYAQKSGKPIFGITYSIAHSLVVRKSWDDMLLPFPFCKGMYAATKPFFIPKKATPSQMEEYRKNIEDELNNLTWDMDKKMGLPHISKGKIKKKRKQHNSDNITKES